MKNIYILVLVVLCLSACSQEAQPYEELNESLPSSSEQGYIDTH
nr:hypothetical protein [Sulfurimonas sp. MAG313]